MIVVPDGTSLIAAGLDHWYEKEGGEEEGTRVDSGEFHVEEWRLQRRLGVSHFRLPPDFRETSPGDSVPNAWLTVPFLRFPQWHFCPACYWLERRPLTERGRVKCRECETKRRKNRYLVQVPFVAMCDEGHIQDFPWREWVHENARPSCDRPMRLKTTGAATLAGHRVECECSATRTLASVTEASTDGTTTHVSSNLSKDGQYLCRGGRPWLGYNEDFRCSRPLRGSLRSASNVYFPLVESSIYLPRGNDSTPSEVVSLFEEPPLSTVIELLAGAGANIDPAPLREKYPDLLGSFSNAQVGAAIEIVRSGGMPESETEVRTIASDDRETAFRRAEFDVLRTSRHEDQLVIDVSDLEQYGTAMAQFFSRIALVTKLRETRALTGFTRVFPERGESAEYRQALLWRGEHQAWLPAYVVYGEGLYIELNEVRLRRWEDRSGVAGRVKPLIERYHKAQDARHLRDRPLGPRFVLLHTLSHLIINRLTFECGYSSASLRERLYVSDSREAPMAGILIYTAAGDVEGTMGGLVRMGKPGNFEPALGRAIEEARWCSSDPVCMEIGALAGQGPDSCNLAACHNCALVPETACEEFNRFLDRGLLVGDLAEKELGFFHQML